MVQAKSIIPFGKPPRSIHIAGTPSPCVYTVEDVDAARNEGLRAGREEVTRTYEARLADLRQEFSQLQTQTFGVINDRFEQALAQMRSLLPQLVVEATARVVAGVKIDGAVLSGIVEDLLSEVAPGAEQLEVQLCEEDIAKIESFQPQFRLKFPAIEFRVARDLKSGDCMVKTRFGVLDGRIETKLRGLQSLLS